MEKKKSKKKVSKKVSKGLEKKEKSIKEDSSNEKGSVKKVNLSKISNELKSLKKGESVIIITKDETYFSVASKVLGYLTKNKKESGAYISISKPYSKVIKMVKGVDWSKVLFLDGISRSLREEEPEGAPCVFLQGPTSLTEIGISLVKASQKGNLDFVIVDSVSSILTYNPEKTALRFVQYIASKSKNLEMVGIVVVHASDEEKSIVRALKDMSDKIIKV